MDDGSKTYVARGKKGLCIISGKLVPSAGCTYYCENVGSGYVSDSDKLFSVKEYEVLVSKCRVTVSKGELSDVSTFSASSRWKLRYALLASISCMAGMAPVGCILERERELRSAVFPSINFFHFFCAQRSSATKRLYVPRNSETDCCNPWFGTVDHYTPERPPNGEG